MKKILLITILSLSLTFAIVEIGLRIRERGREIYIPRYLHKHSHIAYNKYYQADFLPNTIFSLHRINNLGFKGDDIQESKPENTVRIAFLGGSTTLGTSVDYNNNWPGLIKTRIEADSLFPGKKTEILNLAIMGQTSTISLLKFQLKVIEYSPDIAVFYHGWNDMSTWLTIPDIKADYSNFSISPLKEYRESTFYKIFTDALNKLFEKSLFYLKVRAKLIENYNYRKQIRISKKIMKNMISENEIKRKNAGIKIVMKNIANLAGICQHRKITLFVCTFKSLLKRDPVVQEYLSKTTAPCPDVSFEIINRFMEELNENIRVYCTENNINLIDVEKKFPSRRDCFTDIIHFSAKGEEKMSSIVYDKIKNSFKKKAEAGY